jgi:hypothetical protein
VETGHSNSVGLQGEVRGMHVLVKVVVVERKKLLCNSRFSKQAVPSNVLSRAMLGVSGLTSSLLHVMMSGTE